MDIAVSSFLLRLQRARSGNPIAALLRALTRPAAVLMVPGPALASQLPSVLTARVSGGKLAPRAKLAALKQVPPSQMLKRAARA